ncbi:hypothetical protein VSAK1_26410 [Vibrio mediterranei AK1]|nr:hypothetical protein VSAK1_26410 [Vibrio mediterranei AK1]
MKPPSIGKTKLVLLTFARELAKQRDATDELVH